MNNTANQFSAFKKNRPYKLNLLNALAALTLLMIQGLWGPGVSSAADSQAELKDIRRAVTTVQPNTTPGSPVQKKGDLYALVVGVAKYKHPDIRQLQLSDGDATAFAEFLKTQKKIFKKTNVKLMVNEQATKRDMEKHLQYELLKAGKDDTVVLFFSGHGSGDPKKPGEYFFLGHDSDPKYLEATAVKMSGLKFLKPLDAHRVLVVVDACHAGGASKYIRVATKSGKKSLSDYVREFKESSGKVILTSSKPNEYSQERPNLKQSVFTHYFIKALRGEADSDRNGVVTVREAYDYVYDRTKNETEGAQHPQLEGRYVGSFPVSVVERFEDPIKLEVWFVAQDSRCTDRNCTDPAENVAECTNPLCKDVTIKDGSTMYSGQNYQVAVRTSAPSYLYVYHVGPKGDLYKLFPGKDYIAPGNKIANPLKGGKIYWLPAKDRWLRQDNQVGKEKIYVVAARSRNAILEDLYLHLEKIRARGETTASSKKVQGKMEDYLGRLMAPTKDIVRKVYHPRSGVVPGDKIRSFEMLARIFQAPGLDAVKSVWFWHKTR